MTRTITMEIDDATLTALHLTPEQIAGELRLAAAMKLYEIGRLSSGAASELAGVPKPVFLQRLAEFGLDTFTLSAEELASETRLA